jgi:hypothetical protein
MEKPGNGVLERFLYQFTLLYSSSSTFGTGLAAGMGGALLGSLVGYGIGSMFAPHGGWGGSGYGGYGSGFGSPSGFGGGYIQVHGIMTSRVIILFMPFRTMTLS